MTLLGEWATSLNTPSGVGSYRGELRVWLVRRDVQSNRSVIAWEFGIRKLTGLGRWSAETNIWTLFVNGAVAATGNRQYNFDTVEHDGVAGQGGWIVLTQGEASIDHASSGIGAVRVRGEWYDDSENLQAFTLGPSGVDDPTPLPSIPRATRAVVEPTPIIVGGSAKITLPRSDDSFVHDVTWASGSLSGVVGVSVDTEVSFTPPPAVLDEFPGRTQAPVTITVVTKLGATSIGTSTATLMVKPLPEPPEIGGQDFPFDLRVRRIVRDGAGLRVLSGEVHASRVTLTDVGSATSTLKLQWSELADVSVNELDVVLAEFHDGVQWHAVAAFVMMRDENDEASPDEMHTYSGVDYVDFVLGRARVVQQSGVVGDSRTWNDQTPGAIFAALVSEGKARGWGTFLEVDFTADATSFGGPWTGTSSPSSPLDQPYIDLLAAMVESGEVEYRTAYRGGVAYLELLNPGTGSDWAVAGADPIVNLASGHPRRAPRRSTTEQIATRMTGAGEGELRRTVERSVPEELRIFGHLEGAIAAGDVKTVAELDRIVSAGLDDASKKVDERTFVYSVSAAPRHVWPLYAYRSDDWVLVPGDDGPERMRVAQIELSKDDDGEIEATVVVGDRILSGLAGVARRQRQAAGGAIPGGSGRAPQRLDGSIPSAPVLAPLTSGGYWDSDGAARATVTSEWAAITTALDGSDIAVAHYEVWDRPTALDQWGMRTIVSTLTSTTSGLDVVAPFAVRVRAVSTAGVAGAWSDFESTVTAMPAASLSAPDVPTVTANALGLVTAEWDGLLASAAAPKHLAHVRAEISDTGAAPWSVFGTPLVSAGATSIDPGAYRQWWVRMVPVDRLGQDGTPSASVSVTTVDPNIDPRKPAAPTGLTVTSTGLWTASAPQAMFAADWDDVDVDEDGAPLEVLLYEIWGRLEDDPAPRLLTASSPSSATWGPVDPGSEWLLSVRAQSAMRVWGALSAEVPVTAAEPVFDLDAPAPPSVSSSRGAVRVVINALGVPSWVVRFDIEVSADDEPFKVVDVLPRPGGQSTLTEYPPGTEVSVRVVAVDRLGRASDPSDSVTIAVVGIQGPDLEANSVAANHIEAGSIQVEHIAPGVGNALILDGNVSIVAVNDAVAAAQSSADGTAAALAAHQQRYDFDEVELRFSQPGSPFEVGLNNERMEFREGGVPRAYLSAGQWNAESIVTPQIVIGPHLIEHDGTGLVFRRIGS